MLLLNGDSGEEVERTRTNHEGHFEFQAPVFPLLSAGIGVRADGHAHWTSCCFTAESHVRIVVDPLASGRLMGRVVSAETGEGLVGAAIRVWGDGAEGVVAEVSSGLEGGYCLDAGALKSGLYSVTATANGRAAATRFWDARETAEVKIAFALPTESVRIVSGQVVDYVTYDPIAGALVEDAYGTTTRTSSDGSFSMAASWSKGQVGMLQVSKDGYVPLATNPVDPEVDLVVELSRVTRCAIRIQVPFEVPGLSCVFLTPRYGMRDTALETLMECHPSGEYRAHATGAARRQATLAIIRGKGVASVLATAGTWDGTEDGWEMLPVVALERGSSISGTVVSSESGAAISDVMFAAFPEPSAEIKRKAELESSLLQTTSDSRGNFQLHGLTSGHSYRLCAYRRGWAPRSIAQVSGQSALTVQLDRHDQAALDGHVVVDAHGLAGAVVTAVNGSGDRWATMTGATGEFLINALDEDYRLVVAVPAGGSVRSRNKVFRGPYRGGTTSIELEIKDEDE